MIIKRLHSGVGRTGGCGGRWHSRGTSATRRRAPRLATAAAACETPSPPSSAPPHAVRLPRSPPATAPLAPACMHTRHGVGDATATARRSQVCNRAAYTYDISNVL